MKNLLIMFCLVLGTTITYGQEKKAETKNSEVQTSNQKKMNATERATKMTNKMDEILKFSPEQKSAVYEINLKTIKLNRDVKNDKTLSEEMKKTQIKNHNKEKRNEINKLLTSKQKEILKERRLKENDENDND